MLQQDFLHTAYLNNESDKNMFILVTHINPEDL